MTNRTIFVFGSNEAGIHGAGAAKTAYQKHGARWGMSYGHYGDSFAIPTKDQNLKTLSTGRINNYVSGFIAYAKGHPELTFQVTRIGCGLAGLKDEDVAVIFNEAPSNCCFDTAWAPYLKADTDNKKFEFWGTF